MFKNNPLKKPTLPQEDKNGIIDVSIKHNDFMLIVINYFDTEKPEEKINILLNGVKVKDAYYFIEPPIPYSIHIPIPFSKIPDGDYDVVYTVTDAANTGFSEPAHVKIINSPSIGNIKLQWINVLSQANANETLHEKLLLESHGIVPKTDVTFKLDHTDVVFKMTNSQEWNTKIDSSGLVNLSIISLQNKNIEFTISAYFTNNPKIKAPPLPVKFTSINALPLKFMNSTITVGSPVTLTATVMWGTKEEIEIDFLNARNYFTSIPVKATFNPPSKKTNDMGEASTIFTSYNASRIQVQAENYSLGFHGLADIIVTNLNNITMECSGDVLYPKGIIILTVTVKDKNNHLLNGVLVEFSNDEFSNGTLFFTPISGLTENGQFITNVSGGNINWSNGPEYVTAVATIKGPQGYTEYVSTQIQIHRSSGIG
ncbi:Ig-like domain-containing protein [Xenorhabdus sp. KJ12.1]|uniref:Ig-like domain-containing protein n=1 Tax=Xenorhabdus sp. KJ12.1 TaxID=1851571 RepID=UPI000C053FB0|nr:Ig-like domain-containing protein [Xenorhabdus sp. KJ12.1]PHM71214.1 hypothetical protein Xekj_01240 [Xenorhabdus sp. KJ12.1]